MSDIKSLQKDIVKFREDRDWEQFHNLKDLAISLTLEASELLEHFQWKTAEETAKRSQKDTEEIGDELADVLYWTLLIANDSGIDLEKSFHKKMKKNAEKYPVEKSKGSHKKYTEL